MRAEERYFVIAVIGFQKETIKKSPFNEFYNYDILSSKNLLLLLTHMIIFWPGKKEWEMDKRMDNFLACGKGKDGDVAHTISSCDNRRC